MLATLANELDAFALVSYSSDDGHVVGQLFQCCLFFVG